MRVLTRVQGAHGGIANELARALEELAHADSHQRLGREHAKGGARHLGPDGNRVERSRVDERIGKGREEHDGPRRHSSERPVLAELDRPESADHDRRDETGDQRRARPRDPEGRAKHEQGDCPSAARPPLDSGQTPGGEEREKEIRAGRVDVGIGKTDANRAGELERRGKGRLGPECATRQPRQVQDRRTAGADHEHAQHTAIRVGLPWRGGDDEDEESFEQKGDRPDHQRRVAARRDVGVEASREVDRQQRWRDPGRDHRELDAERDDGDAREESGGPRGCGGPAAVIPNRLPEQPSEPRGDGHHLGPVARSAPEGRDRHRRDRAQREDDHHASGGIGEGDRRKEQQQDAAGGICCERRPEQQRAAQGEDETEGAANQHGRLTRSGLAGGVQGPRRSLANERRCHAV